MRSSSLPIMAFIVTVIINSCGDTRNSHTKDGLKPVPFTGAKGEVKLITLDPGHFHAALVQKNMYDQINPEVFVYSPVGNDIEEHVKRILGYNSRA